MIGGVRRRSTTRKSGRKGTRKSRQNVVARQERKNRQNTMRKNRRNGRKDRR